MQLRKHWQDKKGHSSLDIIHINGGDVLASSSKVEGGGLLDISGQFYKQATLYYSMRGRTILKAGTLLHTYYD